MYVIHDEYAAPLFEIYPNDDYAVFGGTNGQALHSWECDTDRWTHTIKNTGTYSKPASGIPASDLASGVIPTVPDAATATPVMDGTAAVGSSTKYAKEDHVHPSDTTKADKVTVTTVSDVGAVSQALDAGKIYDFTGALTSLTITLNAATAPAYYHFRFDSGSTAVSLALPQTVTMPSGFQVEASKHYEIDILDGYGIA